MKKCIVLMVILFSIASCDSPQTENESPVASKESGLKTERVFFKDWTDLTNEYARISKLSKEEIFGENDYESIIQNDESRENLSPALNKFMNKDNEFQIGNEIMWFKDGNFYSFNVKDEKILDSLKLNYKNIPVSEKIVTGIVSESKSNNKGLSSRTSIGTNGAIDARYQYQFRRQSYYDCGSTVNQGTTTRDQKYVHELYTETVNGWNSLYLRVKLEWNPSGGKWRFAGEKRTITVNISGNAILTTTYGDEVPGTYGQFAVNQTYNCSQDQTILLYYSQDFGSPQWHVDITGTIYQQINGDAYYNAWTNYVNW
ncbi:hypothetical protein [Flavobacterium aquiphilum]|uniref:hypothetical protein n=1 Tax=Flavobacterium aquiphilum TaxID=3003261 RepID=UPI00247FA1DA|nr:hypothetical protein [Flavobacterium aquiphilum]